VTQYYLTTAGLPPPPQTSLQLSRLLALATQKFIADIAGDAYQYSRIRHTTSSANNAIGALAGGTAQPVGNKDAPAVPVVPSKGAAGLGVQRPGFGGGGGGAGSAGKIVLTMEDLGMAVGEYGVNLKRSEFYR
jgi:transcription initiation factor TFIID subunit 10